MKKFLLLSAFIIGTAFVMTATAQLRLSFRFGHPPAYRYQDGHSRQHFGNNGYNENDRYQRSYGYGGSKYGVQHDRNDEFGNGYDNHRQYQGNNQEGYDKKSHDQYGNGGRDNHQEYSNNGQNNRYEHGNMGNNGNYGHNRDGNYNRGWGR